MFNNEKEKATTAKHNFRNSGKTAGTTTTKQTNKHEAVAFPELLKEKLLHCMILLLLLLLIALCERSGIE